MESNNTIWGRTRQIQLTILLICVFAFGFILGDQYTISRAQSDRHVLSQDVAPLFEPLYETYNLIDQQYIDMPEPEVLVNGAIRGMVLALDDPYSNYVDPEHYPFVSDDLAGEIEGIGVTITENQETGEIEVVNVLRNTPAERAGLQAGDAFIIVNGENVVGLTYLELAARVRGPAGSTVDITMRRGSDLVEFTVERARIEIPNIEVEMLENNIGYIGMAQFSSMARSQVNDALATLGAANLNGLIFDLRGNSGGLLSAATEIAALFLEEGIILIEDFGGGEKEVYKVVDGVVIRVLSDGREQTYTTNAAYSGLTVPVVVLVNQQSASASELVAGTWQDHGVVTVIGETTFGKGTVQFQNTLSNGGGVRLTVARWLTPNGNWISELGVTPDIVVEIAQDAELSEGKDPQLTVAVEFILSQIAVPIDD